MTAKFKIILSFLNNVDNTFIALTLALAVALALALAHALALILALALGVRVRDRVHLKTILKFKKVFNSKQANNFKFPK